MKKEKFLILYSLICGIFISQHGLCATSSVPDKSSKFSQILSSSDDTTYDSELARQIQAQRAARDNQDARNATEQKVTTKKSTCDNDLRECIENKCNTDYSKCATDSDTTFSDKLNACRKNTKCTTHEFNLFATQIKEDKKQIIDLSSYTKTINCGARYNDCIRAECGQKFDNCLGKSANDKALAKCKSIATECTESDSGLASRMGTIFGLVRTATEKTIANDEKKLRDLRDKMRETCNNMGALFDDRSLNCVFTVTFSAGEDDSTIRASKKLYAGTTFDCTPEWFGIDVTTFRENAWRRTRAAKAASSAVFGAGAGSAIGAVTSGAVSRSAEAARAKKALKDAQNGNDQSSQQTTTGTDSTSPTTTPKTKNNESKPSATTNNNTSSANTQSNGASSKGTSSPSNKPSPSSNSKKPPQTPNTEIPNFDTQKGL